MAWRIEKSVVEGVIDNWLSGEEEEKQQREANERAMIHFMEDLAEAGETAEGEDPFEEEDCDPFPERPEEDEPIDDEPE